MKLRSWESEIGDLAHDLLHLETNTIVADGITGRKMPSYPHALLDVAHRYLNFLEREFKLELKKYWYVARDGQDEEQKRKKLKHPDPEVAPAFKKDAEALWTKEVKNDVDTFMRLHFAAAYVLNHPKEAKDAGFPVTERTRPIVVRIKRNCDALIAIVEELMLLKREEPGGDGSRKPFLGKSRRELASVRGFPPRPPTELTIRLRKIWDIGTDEIIMQTVLQLDGDVVNRIKRDFDLEKNAPLWNTHQRIVVLGIENWQKMFELLLGLIGSAFKALLGR